MPVDTKDPEASTGRNVRSNLLTGTRTNPDSCDEVDLAKVLSYKNHDVTERFEDELNLTPDEARQLFSDVLLFLYICATKAKGASISPPRMIDKGWHEFLMFTRDYRKFCKEYLGKFIDHCPFTRKRRSVLHGEPNNTARIIAAELICNQLSENWNRNENSCSTDHDRCSDTVARANCGDCSNSDGTCECHSDRCEPSS